MLNQISCLWSCNLRSSSYASHLLVQPTKPNIPDGSIPKLYTTRGWGDDEENGSKILICIYFMLLVINKVGCNLLELKYHSRIIQKQYGSSITIFHVIRILFGSEVHCTQFLHLY